MESKNTFRGLSWFFLSLIVSVSLDVLSKKAGQSLSGAEVTFYRYLFGSLVLIPFLIHQWLQSGFCITPYWKVHIFRGLLLFGAIWLRCYGLQYVAINTAVVLNYAVPFFTLIFSVPILHEHSSRSRWITTIIAFSGLLFVLNPSDMSGKYVSILLLSAFMFSLVDIYNKKYICKESMINMLFYTALCAFVFSIYPAYKNTTCTFFTGLWNNLWVILGLGIGANLFFYCLLKAFSYMDASALAPFQYCDFIISAIMGYVCFSEKLTLSTCCGFAIIAPCALFLTYKESKKK